MNKVVEEGTGRRAILDNTKAAGKTGTTNAYRDAWFIGYTGNYVAGVWAGNDDYSPTNRMTGGSLPAMTWRQIMAYAHQGIELKPIAGVAPGPTPPAPQTVAASNAANDAASRPTLLTKRGAEVLLRVERLMEQAARVSVRADGGAAGTAADAAQPPAGSRVSAAEPKPPSSVRGN
jgi:penicillin-binding protein 1A